MTSRPQVAVLGNGPVGQSAALLLARWGIRVLLLDARPGRELTGSRSICQQRDVLDIWACAGAGDQIAAEGLTWATARTFYRGTELFAHTLGEPGAAGFPPFVNLSQARAEQLLDERIAAQPLIETRWSHEVTDLAQDDAGVAISAATPAGPAEIRADYAIACTGAHSSELHRALGVSFAGHSFDDRFLICDIRADLPGWARERRFYFDPPWNPGRQVLIHPCPGSTFRIDWQVPAGYDLAAEQSDGRLDARIRAIIGDAPYELLWATVYRFQSRLASRMRVGRILLAGDCAHLMAPFGARGLNSGVADAENAAWKLAYQLHHWSGPALLETYHTERHAAARENLDITTATMNFLVPQTEEQHAHRRTTLSRAATDPAARAQVDSGRLAEPFWYPDSPLTTPSPAHPFTGRPPRGTPPPPAPGILLPDTPVGPPGHPTPDGILLPDPPAGPSGRPTRDGILPPDPPAELPGRPTRDGILLPDPPAELPGHPTRDGILLPDPPAELPGRPTRLRQLARDGILLLAMLETTDLREASAHIPGPHRILTIDPTGTLAQTLNAHPGELWIIRPDAYVAAILDHPTPSAVISAARQALGHAQAQPNQ